MDPGTDRHGPAIAVVGMGIDGLPPASAARALAEADLVIGTRRHLALVTKLTTATREYPSPFTELWPLLERNRDQRIVLLASGDPLLYGVGSSLLRRLPAATITFHPNVSSVQAALARVHRPWQEATVISLHGRPLDELKSRLRANRLYVCLTDARSPPTAIARLLVAAGYPDSTLWVAENLGAANERLTRFTAAAPPAEAFSPLNVVVVETRGRGGVLPEFPGIPDEQFSTDSDTPGKGMISKREVRLMALSLLAPRAGETGWDVGAGCGGISVEWARWNRRGRLFAVERDCDRVRHLEANRARFGVSANLKIVHGRAPEALLDLPDPDAVYVGGSDGDIGEMSAVCWQRLRSGGRLVTAAVTEESRAALREFAGSARVHWSQLAIAREDQLGSQHVMRPRLPVLLLQRVKG